MLPEHLPKGLKALIEACLHWKGIDFTNYKVADQNREPGVLYKDAQVVSSELGDRWQQPMNVPVPKTPFPARPSQRNHIIALDIDVPAWCIPSSTDGHSHLYISHQLQWPQYEKLLRVLAEIGLIEEGYKDASIKRKATFLRLPWVKKGMETLPSPEAIEEFLNEPDQPGSTTPASAAETDPGGQASNQAGTNPADVGGNGNQGPLPLPRLSVMEDPNLPF